LFFAISYLISWSSLFIFGNVDGTIPSYIAKFGFSLSAIILLLFYRDKEKTAEIIEYAKTPVRWTYLLLALSPILAYFASILIAVPFAELSIVKGESFLQWAYVILIAPTSGILFYSLLRGGLGEEIGLRAYVLPLIASKQSLLRTALIIGIVWALWHYPVWINNGIVSLVAGTLATIAWSLIFTLVFVKTKSLWIVILLHATGNAADDIFEFIFPNIVNYDWEIFYILLVVVFGVVALVILRKTPNSFNKFQIEGEK